MYAENLREIRHKNKLTQQHLADCLGLTRSAYCSYETGRRTPDLETIIKLSKFYRIPAEQFLGENTENIADTGVQYGEHPDMQFLSQLSAKEIDLVVNYRISSEADKKALLNTSKATKAAAIALMNNKNKD